MEEAEGYQQLMDTFSLTQEEVSKRVGKSRSAIANALRLNNLSEEVKKMVVDGSLTQGHARALLPILEETTQILIAKKIVEEGLNVRQVERLVASMDEKKTPQKRNTVSPLLSKYYKDVEHSLSERFGTKVKISEGARKGKIEIEYYSKDDLERILFELRS
jgi:ParB family chromosome partitioning protein